MNILTPIYSLFIDELDWMRNLVPINTWILIISLLSITDWIFYWMLMIIFLVLNKSVMNQVMLSYYCLNINLIDFNTLHWVSIVKMISFLSCYYLSLTLSMKNISLDPVILFDSLLKISILLKIHLESWKINLICFLLLLSFISIAIDQHNSMKENSKVLIFWRICFEVLALKKEIGITLFY